jgi:hypothetical protein
VGKLVADITMSLDGFITGPDDAAGPGPGERGQAGGPGAGSGADAAAGVRVTEDLGASGLAGGSGASWHTFSSHEPGSSRKKLSHPSGHHDSRAPVGQLAASTRWVR